MRLVHSVRECNVACCTVAMRVAPRRALTHRARFRELVRTLFLLLLRQLRLLLCDGCGHIVVAILDLCSICGLGRLDHLHCFVLCEKLTNECGARRGREKSKSE